MIDIHCHLLPGLDDGAKDQETCREMLRAACADGIQAILATPHYNSGAPSDYSKRRNFALAAASRMAEEIQPGFRLYPGFELYFDSTIPDQLAAGKPLSLNGTKYVLLEVLPSAEFSYIQRAVQEIQYAGFWPILAHIERYEALSRPERVKDLIDMGAFMQMNADSLLGKLGWGRTRQLWTMVKKGYIHVIGCDAHDASLRGFHMAECGEAIRKRLGEEARDRLCRDNAMSIIKGVYLGE